MRSLCWTTCSPLSPADDFLAPAKAHSGVAPWARMEKGDPTVSLGAYAQALFVLVFDAPLADLIDQRRDEQGLLLEAEQLPKRVTPPRKQKRRS